MDLADLWQEHKTFILTVVGALVLLLVGRALVIDRYGYDDIASSTQSKTRDIRRKPDVSSTQVADLRNEVDALRERLASLSSAMQYELDEVFQLPPGEPNPGNFCWQRTRTMQQVLVDEAARRDIAVPDSLGLQDSAPTDLQEVRRTLRALSVIQGVVIACIDAGIRRIDEITIHPEARRRSRGASFVQSLTVGFEIVGNEESLREVIARLVEDPKQAETPYLEITDPTKIEPDRDDPRFLRLELNVAALEIDVSEFELEGA